MQEGSKKKQEASDWQERSETLLILREYDNPHRKLWHSIKKEKLPGTTM